MRQAALALLAIGIVGGSGAGPAWAEGAKEAIAAADRTFAEAFNRGDAATVAKLYTTDAALLPPGDPRVDGREGIQDYWQAAIDAGVKDLALSPEEVSETGDLAYEVGTLALTIPGDEGNEETVTAKYVAVWHLDSDGTWRLHRDIWNESPAEGE